MSSDDTQIEVKNNPERHHYEAQVDGRTAFINYAMHGNTIRYIHTEVPPEMEGQGIGSKLAKFALQEAKERHWKVVPQCPFIAAYVKKHQEYQPLVTQSF